MLCTVMFPLTAILTTCIQSRYNMLILLNKVSDSHFKNVYIQTRHLNTKL